LLLFSNKELSIPLTGYFDLSLEELSFMLPEKEQKYAKELFEEAMENKKKKLAKEIYFFDDEKQKKLF
jgi:hypothetical protein